jgi:hypothetical protein
MKIVTRIMPALVVWIAVVATLAGQGAPAQRPAGRVVPASPASPGQVRPTTSPSRATTSAPDPAMLKQYCIG